MDISSFAKGGIRRLQTPFLVKDSGKGVFCLWVKIKIRVPEFQNVSIRFPGLNRQPESLLGEAERIQQNLLI